jgi:cell division protein ZapA
MTDKPNQVAVEIFGQTYTVKAGADPAYVEALAKYVDAQMREVSQAAGAVDSMRIAVLAALNIADEAFRLKNTARDVEDGARRRVSALAKQLAAALGE